MNTCVSSLKWTQIEAVSTPPPDTHRLTITKHSEVQVGGSTNGVYFHCGFYREVAGMSNERKKRDGLSLLLEELRRVIPILERIVANDSQAEAVSSGDQG